ncbi:MAG: serine hydrolase domain-containing protein [Bacteroidota bacterium]
MKRNISIKLVLVTTILLKSSMLICQPKPFKKLEKFQEKAINDLFEEWDSKKTPGASIAVIHNREIVLKHSFGMANLEHDIPLTSSSLFNIASNSKQFTVFALLNLAKENKLSIADDIRIHLPELPDFGHKITIQHLMQHTHGIRGITPLLGMAGWNIEDVMTREAILNILSNQKELDFEPGTNFSYNNSGYMLLAEIIERVSGSSFHDYLQTNIFEPLAMNATVLFEDNEKVIPKMASPYYFDGTSYKKGIRNFKDIVGNTGIRTSIEDLSKWINNYGTHQIGSTAIFQKMLQPTVLSNGEKLEYCFGLKKSHFKGRQVISHGGAHVGYRSQMLRFPNDNVAIVVLSNNGSLDADGKAYKIAEILFGEKNDQNSNTIDAKSNIPEMNTESMDFSGLEGKFELQPGFIMEFEQREEKLFITATGQGTFPLETITNEKFKISQIGAIIEFLKNGQGNYDSLRFNHGNQEMKGKRVVFQLEGSQLEAFVGSYHSPELRTTYELKIEDEMLVAKHPRQEKTMLTPLRSDKFSGNTWFFGSLDFERKGEKVMGFKASSARAKNVFFKKLEGPNMY